MNYIETCTKIAFFLWRSSNYRPLKSVLYVRPGWIIYQNMRETWEKKVMKFEREIPIGLDARRKKPQGGGWISPPPNGIRVNSMSHNSSLFSNRMICRDHLNSQKSFFHPSANGVGFILHLFLLCYYYDYFCFVFRATDEVFQVLEDNQVTLSTMKASRFVKAFEKEVDYWERTLSHILEVIEMTLTVQRQWMYLEVSDLWPFQYQLLLSLMN